jgi:hypothetical protein
MANFEKKIRSLGDQMVEECRKEYLKSQELCQGVLNELTEYKKQNQLLFEANQKQEEAYKTMFKAGQDLDQEYQAYKKTCQQNEQVYVRDLQTYLKLDADYKALLVELENYKIELQKYQQYFSQQNQNQQPQYQQQQYQQQQYQQQQYQQQQYQQQQEEERLRREAVERSRKEAEELRGKLRQQKAEQKAQQEREAREAREAAEEAQRNYASARSKAEAEEERQKRQREKQRQQEQFRAPPPFRPNSQAQPPPPFRPNPQAQPPPPFRPNPQAQPPPPASNAEPQKLQCLYTKQLKQQLEEELERESQALYQELTTRLKANRGGNYYLDPDTKKAIGDGVDKLRGLFNKKRTKLLKFHPDKNPGCLEEAQAAFQFLQRVPDKYINEINDSIYRYGVQFGGGNKRRTTRNRKHKRANTRKTR